LGIKLLYLIHHCRPLGLENALLGTQALRLVTADQAKQDDKMER
jgi:hypothetical protein